MQDKEARFVEPSDNILKGMQVRPVVEKLLLVAEQVHISGQNVTADDISLAKQFGATDEMIHDTILIAAAFCMFTRYVDGLACNTPTTLEVYRDAGKRLAEKGYGND